MDWGPRAALWCAQTVTLDRYLFLISNYLRWQRETCSIKKEF